MAEAFSSAEDIVPPSAAQFSELLAKLDVAHIDPGCRKSSAESMRALMQKQVHDSHSLAFFVDTLLGSALDKKTMQKHLLSIALLLAEIAHHATHLHLKLSLSHISSIGKLLVSWFPLAMEPASQTHALHQACAKLACSIAENAAAHLSDDTRSSASTCSSLSFTEKSCENSGFNLDSSSSCSSCNEDAPSTVAAMESLCRPLMLAAFSKVEPSIRGGSTCLQALVLMDTWRFASLSLIEELCTKAVNAIQERKALSVSTVQMSLLCSLSKTNHDSLSCYRAVLLKKAGEVLLVQNGQWQQRVAAVRLIECLLSMSGNCHVSSKHEAQAIEVLEQCRFDKVAMVRSAVMEALKKIKQQKMQDTGVNERLTPIVSSASRSSLPKTNLAVDYGRRRRKKSLQGIQFPSPQSRTNDLSPGNDRWINKVTPHSGWSSSDSVNSSIDFKCPRRKVPRTLPLDGEKEASHGKGGGSDSSGNSTHKKNIEAQLPRVCNNVDSRTTDLQDLGDFEIKSTTLNPEESHVCSSNMNNIANDHTCGIEEESNTSCVTPTHVHHNPIAEAESLEDVESHEVCQSPENLSDNVLPTISINLVMPRLGHIKPQSVDLLEGMPRKEHFNDTAWNVRNNPIATDDSDIDSPRPSVLENCSLIYCDDGDDELEDGKVQAGEQQAASHARQPKEREDFVYQVYHGHLEEADKEGANDSRACSSNYAVRERRKWSDTSNGIKQQVISILGDGVVTNESTTNSYDCSSDIEAAEKLPQTPRGTLSFKCSKEDTSTTNLFSLKETFEASSVQDESIVHVPKGMPMVGDKVQDHGNTCYGFNSAHDSITRGYCNVPKGMPLGSKEGREHLHVCHGLNRSVHECALKGYCNDCHCLLQDSQTNRGTIEEQAQYGHNIISTQDVGLACSVIDEGVAEGHESAGDSPSFVIMDEHAGAGDNVDVVVANFESNPRALGTDEEDQESLSQQSLHQGQYEELKSFSPPAEDFQSLNTGIAREALLARSSKEKSAAEEERDRRGKGSGQNNTSIVRWFRDCFVVRKLGMFGTLFLVLTIPLAIVSIINTFERDEDANDFLVPT